MSKLFLLILATLTLNPCVYAQGSIDDLFQIDLRKNIDTGNGSISFYTVKEFEENEVQLGKEYYWFANGKIHHTYGGVHGEVLNGQYIHLYRSGNLYKSGLFVQGLKSGKWITWNENGTIQSIYYWQNGSLNGGFEEYDNDGKIVRKGNFENNKLIGKVYYYKNKEVTRVEKFRGGKLISTKFFLIESQGMDSLKKQE